MSDKKTKIETPKAKAAAAPEKAATTEKVPEVKLVSTAQLAAKLGTKPTILRRYLRSLPKYTDNNYTRYGWNPDDQFLKDVEASFKKYQTSESEKAEKRKADLAEKAAKRAAEPAKEKPAKKAKKEVVAESEEAEEVFEGEGEDFGDEVEEIE